MGTRKRTDRRNVEMAACGLKIPAHILREVGAYGVARGISRNASFEELVRIALHGKGSILITKEMINKAIAIATEPRQNES